MNQGPFPIGDLPDKNTPKEVNALPPGQRFQQVEPHQSSNPIVDAAQKVGFTPDVVFNVTGTTFPDPKTGLNRQDYLSKIEYKDPQTGLTREAGSLVLYNRYGGLPLSLEHDIGNKFDEYAVSVLLPTRDNSAGDFTEWRSVGFIPRKLCWNCYTALSGKKADLPTCPECGHPVAADRCTLNKYILDRSAESQPMIAVVWVSQGKDGNKIGVRLAAKF